jgi:hypothetical protein
MPDDKPAWRDVASLYEQGKHRRYGLLFAVNGGAFALGKLLVGSGGQQAAVLGGLTVSMLAVGMAAFTLVMCIDIWKFGERMRGLDPALFGPWGQRVLMAIGALLVLGWWIVAFVPAPGGAVG